MNEESKEKVDYVFAASSPAHDLLYNGNIRNLKRHNILGSKDKYKCTSLVTLPLLSKA